MDTNLEELTTKIEQQRLFLRGALEILKQLNVPLDIVYIERNRMKLQYTEQILWNQKRDLYIEIMITFSEFPNQYEIRAEKSSSVKPCSVRHNKYEKNEYIYYTSYLSTPIHIAFMEDTSDFTDQISVDKAFIDELKQMWA